MISIIVTCQSCGDKYEIPFPENPYIGDIRRFMRDKGWWVSNAAQSLNGHKVWSTRCHVCGVPTEREVKKR